MRDQMVQCGRKISSEEMELICEMVELFPRLALKELAATICEHLGWYTAAGNLKEEACLKLLRKLEAQGLVQLPEQKMHKKRSSPRKIQLSSRTDAGPQITGSLKELVPVWLKAVEDRVEKGLWNEYVARYHRLGYKQPFGYRMRYFIGCSRGTLGCLLFSGPAKALGARDRWIGWSDEQRLQRLAWVINNSRFLLFLP